MSFEIDAQRLDIPGTHGPWTIAIHANGTSLLRLFRGRTNRFDEAIHAPPAQLAFWLLDNWWRIR